MSFNPLIMNKKFLIIYSTTDGHTKLICEKISSKLFEKNISTQIVLINEIGNIPLEDFDKIIIGASIRYGKHSTYILNFINANWELLNSKPNAFFSVNVVARKNEKNTPETNPYVKKFLKQIPWKPSIVAIFAGKIDYPSYTYFDRQMIRLIMWMTKGPTDPNANIEFTDWKIVDNFADQISTFN